MAHQEDHQELSLLVHQDLEETLSLNWSPNNSDWFMFQQKKFWKMKFRKIQKLERSSLKPLMKARISQMKSSILLWKRDLSNLIAVSTVGWWKASPTLRLKSICSKLWGSSQAWSSCSRELKTNHLVAWVTVESTQPPVRSTTWRLTHRAMRLRPVVWSRWSKTRTKLWGSVITSWETSWFSWRRLSDQSFRTCSRREPSKRWMNILPMLSQIPYELKSININI